MTKYLHVQLNDSSSTSSQKSAKVDLIESAVPPSKKTKSNPLQKLLGNKFQSTSSSGFSSTAAMHDEIVTSEISRYKAEKPVELNENILLWWIYSLFADYRFIDLQFVYTLNTKTPYSWLSKPQT